MTGIDRTQVLRIDCTACKGHGYVTTAAGQADCAACGGSGMMEREVPFKFETNGRWEKEEVAQVFELPVDQVKDEGHAEAKTPAGDPTTE